VGWKIGLNIPELEELVGTGPVVGYLTSATMVAPGSTIGALPIRSARAECEVAALLGKDVHAGEDAGGIRAAITGVATALEVCDVARPPATAEAIIAENVFHRAFALGPTRSLPARPFVARISINGEVASEASPSEDYSERIASIAQQLAVFGEQLRVGDRVLCGAITGGPAAPGDHIDATVDDLGAVSLHLGRHP
jgi:2-keto-4-pentenoate hydratase